MKSIRSR
jgi:hypothetical protein